MIKNSLISELQKLKVILGLLCTGRTFDVGQKLIRFKEILLHCRKSAFRKLSQRESNVNENFNYYSEILFAVPQVVSQTKNRLLNFSHSQFGNCI